VATGAIVVHNLCKIFPMSITRHQRDTICESTHDVTQMVGEGGTRGICAFSRYKLRSYKLPCEPVEHIISVEALSDVQQW